MSRLRRVARRSSIVFLVAGLAALGYAAFLEIDARAYQRTEARRFAQARAAAAISAALPATAVPAVVAPVPADGETIGQIVIPRLGIDLIIAQGESEEILERAVGHLPATALPGVTGNVVLAAHRDTFFRPLKDVRIGDAITVRTDVDEFDYVVESISVVKPTDVYVLRPTGGQTLTLITCFPFYYVGAAPNRFIVRARIS
jgi:sortase A